MAASDKLTDLLQKDHSFIKEDYNRWKASKNAEEKIRWANQFILDVSQHSVAEEIVYYPEIEKRQKGGSISKQKHLDEHQEVKNMLYNLDRMNYTDPGYDALLERIYSALQTHIKDEEENDFPEFNSLAAVDEQIELGRTFRNRRAMVPTHPHPDAPAGRPIMETLVGMMATPADKARDAMRTFPDEARQRVL
eukprot:tig00001214_g7543.t1